MIILAVIFQLAIMPTGAPQAKPFDVPNKFSTEQECINYAKANLNSLMAQKGLSNTSGNYSCTAVKEQLCPHSQTKLLNPLIL